LGGLISLTDAPVHEGNLETLLTNDGPFECIITHLTLPVCFVIMTNHRKPKESGCGRWSVGQIYISCFEAL